MNKIIPLLLVLFVGEILMRDSAAVQLNFVVFLGILVFRLIFWRFVLALVSLIFKLIAAIFFLRLFR
ncbi:4-hydroxybenzoate polyprenyltransferase [Enterococcus faecium UC8733]|nr:4-hydroxybenzoate polyprenyltransferase [Enterococcus faecium UC8733]